MTVIANWGGLAIDPDLLIDRGYLDPLTVAGTQYPRILAYLAAALVQAQNTIAGSTSSAAASNAAPAAISAAVGSSGTSTSWARGDHTHQVNKQYASALTPLWFYATGTYVPGTGSDDYPALNAALTAFSSAGGGALELPPYTTLNISLPLTVPANVIIIGHNTIIRPTATMTTMMTFTAGGSYMAGVVFVNQSNFASNAIKITKGWDNTELIFERIKIGGATGTGFNKAVWSTSGDVVKFLFCKFQSCATHFAIDSGFMNGVIAFGYFLDGNIIDIGVPGTGQFEPEGLMVFGNHMLPYITGDFAVRIKSGLSNRFSNNVIDQILKTGANGILIDSTGFGIRDTHLLENWFGINGSGSGVGGSQLKLICGATDGLYITNNTFDHAGTWGIEFVIGPGGLVTDFVMTGGRFQNSTTGDVYLVNCRAVFVGVEFNHATQTIVTAGGQASYSDIGCINNGAVFQLGTLPDSIIPTFHFSPRSNISISGSPVFRDGHTTIYDPTTTNSGFSQLYIAAVLNTAIGANLTLQGPGANGTKGIRANGGVLQFVANNGSDILGYFDDAGKLTATTGLQVGGTDDMGARWTSTAGTVGTAAGSGLVASATIRYKRVGYTIALQVKVTVTTVGSGSGYIYVNLPSYIQSLTDAVFSGIETAVTGKALVGNLSASGTAIAIRNYDGSYPITSTSNVLVVEGTYEAA